MPKIAHKIVKKRRRQNAIQPNDWGLNVGYYTQPKQKKSSPPPEDIKLVKTIGSLIVLAFLGFSLLIVWK